mgnify:CR=1 FL=1
MGPVWQAIIVLAGIAGLYTPTGGSIALRGAPLPVGSLFKVARTGLARTFQNLQLFSELSAVDNVMVALRGVYRTPMPLVLLGLAMGEEQRARAAALAAHALMAVPIVGRALVGVVAREEDVPEVAPHEADRLGVEVAARQDVEEDPDDGQGADHPQ